MAIYTRTSNPYIDKVPLRLQRLIPRPQSMNGIRWVSYYHTFPQDFISWVLFDNKSMKVERRLIAVSNLRLL